MDRSDSEPDVVKTIELHSPAARYIACLALFIYLFFFLTVATNGFKFDSGLGPGLFVCAVVGVMAFAVVGAVLCEPYRALIIKKGKIRFDSVMSRMEYDLEKVRSLKVVKDGEGSREIRLEFSDGKSRMLAPTNQFHELAAAIKEVQPSVIIEHLPPNWFERMIGRRE